MTKKWPFKYDRELIIDFWRADGRDPEEYDLCIYIPALDDPKDAAEDILVDARSLARSTCDTIDTMTEFYKAHPELLS